MIALVLALVSATAPAAERETYVAEWIAIGSAKPARTVTLPQKTTEPFVDIVPRAAYRLTEAATDGEGRTLVPAGTILMSVRGRPNVRCEVLRRSKQLRPTCLHDRDGDGRFDNWNTLFMADGSGGGEMFFSSQTWRPETKPIARPVVLQPVSRAEAPRFNVGIRFDGAANAFHSDIFMVCTEPRRIKDWFGGSTPLRLCLPQFRLGTEDYPHTLPLYGGQVTFLSQAGKAVALRVVPPPADYPL